MSCRIEMNRIKTLFRRRTERERSESKSRTKAECDVDVERSCQIPSRCPGPRTKLITKCKSWKDKV